jgi:hypothetical protein
MLSISDSITQHARTTLQVLWELKAAKIDENTTLYTNEIHATATPEMYEYLKEHNINLADAAASRQAASDAHNQEETPNFAKSIENKALTGQYNQPF